MNNRTPYTVRRLRDEYVIIGKIILTDDYLKWSRWEFMSAVMK